MTVIPRSDWKEFSPNRSPYLLHRMSQFFQSTARLH